MTPIHEAIGNKDMEIRFFVLIPVYQAEKYVEECVNSVLNQSYDNYEIILVDDGSKDKSGLICDELTNLYNNIHVVHQPNKGQLASRIRAVNYAKQFSNNCDEISYLVFLDSDDLLHPSTLDCLAWIIHRNAVDCIVVDWIRFSNLQLLSFDNVSKELLMNNSEYITEKNIMYRRLLTDNSLNSMCRKIIKIDKFPSRDYSTMYYIRNGEDLIQSLDIYRNIESLMIINTPFYYYRQNSESVTHKYPSINNATDFSVRELVLDFLDQSLVFDDGDYNEYYKYCKTLILGEIMICINFGMDYSNIIKVIKKICSSDYYYRVTNGGKNPVCTTKWKTIVFFLIMNRYTRRICLKNLIRVSQLKIK